MTIQLSMPTQWAGSTEDDHSKGKAREAQLVMHARSAGSEAITEGPTVLPSGRNAGSAANLITSRPSATAGIVQGVHPLARARKARRKERSRLARRPNSRQIQSYCEK